MSGGGSAGYTDLGVYQKSFHGLMLLGVNDQNRDWAGNLSVTGGVVTATKAVAGSGYTTGDLVNITGGTGAGCVLEVTASAGAVTTVAVISGGTGYAVDTALATQKISGGGDDALTVNITSVLDTPYASGFTYKDNPSIARFIIERGLTDVGGNPFTGRKAFNPDEIITEISDQITVLKSQIEALALTTDLGADFDTAISETESADVVATVASAAITQALSYAANLVSTALSNASTKSAALAPIVHGAVSARETAWSAAALTSAIANAKTAYADVFDNLEVFSPGSVAETDSASALTALLPSIDTLVNIAIQISKQAAMEVINQAMSNALMMVDDAFVARAVQNYERRGLRNFLRNVNRFTAPMADMGAVDGTSYTIGLALLHGDFQSDVSDFQSKLELQLIQTLFENFVSFSASTMNVYLQTYGRQYALKVGLYASVYNALAGQSQQNVAAYTRLIESIFGGRVDAYRAVNHEMPILDTAARMEVNAADSSTTTYIDQAMKERLTLLMGGLDQLYNRRQLELNANSTLVNTIAEINRMRIIAKNEEKARQDEMDVKESVWDLELFQLGGNILSAVSGSVVPTAAKPSPWQTALGATLAVGSIAAGIASANPALVAGGVGAGAKVIENSSAYDSAGNY